MGLLGGEVTNSIIMHSEHTAPTSSSPDEAHSQTEITGNGLADRPGWNCGLRAAVDGKGG